MKVIGYSPMNMSVKTAIVTTYRQTDASFTAKHAISQATQNTPWRTRLKKTPQKMLALGLSVISGILLLGEQAAAATLTELDFNNLTPGTIVTDQFADLGVTFSLVDNSPSTPAPPNPGPLALPLFLSFEPASGIGLYAGESCCDPATDVWFDVELTFIDTIDYFSVLALDADEATIVQGFLDGELVQSLSLPPGKDTQVYPLELGEIGGEWIFDTVVLSAYPDGPEAFDNLAFHTVSQAETVPEPSVMLSLFLLAGASFHSVKRKGLNPNVVR